MPALAPTTIGPVTIGPVEIGPTTISDTGTVSITTLVQLPPASAFAAGPDVPYYWVGRDGGAGTNYSNARLVLGTTDYVWWTLDGEGHDPGLDDPELDGLTGHVVALVGGNRTGSQVATPTAAVIDAIDGWSCSGATDTLEISGPEAVTTGLEWDDATTGAMVGMRSITGAGAPIEGPITGVLSQHLPNPGLDLPIVAIDVLIGSTADNTDRWRVCLWTAAGSTSPTGETLLLDAGRIAAAQVLPDRWARIPVPPSSNIRANQAMWATIKGVANVTPIGGRLIGDALRGDWTGQNLQVANPLAATPIDPDATVPYPSTFTADTLVSTGFVCGVRLIVGGTVGDASYHSAADPATWGVHVAPADLGSTIDFNSNLATVGLSPPFLGMLLVDHGFAVGAARGTQPRVGVFTGGDMSSPSEPDIDGATLLVDGGRLTGSSTTAWENRSLADTPWPASTVTSWWTKNNDDSAGTNIAFAQSPDQANASPAASPMDFPTAEASPSALYGPEYEVFPADSAYNVTNPAVTFVSPFAADPDDQRPRNVPGARLRFRIPGITIAS